MRVAGCLSVLSNAHQFAKTNNHASKPAGKPVEASEADAPQGTIPKTDCSFILISISQECQPSLAHASELLNSGATPPSKLFLKISQLSAHMPQDENLKLAVTTMRSHENPISMQAPACVKYFISVINIAHIILHGNSTGNRRHRARNTELGKTAGVESL